MNRYLINFSYIGTHFRGAQKQTKASPKIILDSTTIQGKMERGLYSLKPKNIISSGISSRTDSGVHAFHNTMHVDLERPNGNPYTTSFMTNTLNKYFTKTEVPIRVFSSYLVPINFSSRNNATRTYLYRLGICNWDRVPETVSFPIPIEEMFRMHCIRSVNFDVEKFREGAKLHLGLNDFRSFMAKSSKSPQRSTRRIMHRFDIEEVPQKCYSPFSWQNYDSSDHYKFYDIYLEANGFLYKQVGGI